MDKRYQVFVSSTFSDLKEERQQVLQALMEMDCIPAGMELFPSIDEEQWEFIKKVINDCDYYLLIIGGRYGSVTTDGISYTEKEFDYAVEIGLKVVAFIHASPDDISVAKSEQDSVLRDKLLTFKDKVMSGRLVKFWKSEEELPGLVALSLIRTIKMYPAIGWVRANNVANEDVLSEINELRKQNTALQLRVTKAEEQQKLFIEDIADFDSKMIVHGTYKIQRNATSSVTYNFDYTFTWREIFSLISPYLVEHPNETVVKLKISSILKKLATGNSNGVYCEIDDQEFKTISIQLKAYGLIKTELLKTISGKMAIFWTLTEKGERLMIESRVIKGTSNNIGDSIEQGAI